MNYHSTENIYEKRKQDRKQAAKQPIEQKVQTLVKLQKASFAMKAATGKTASRPWTNQV